MVLLPLDGRRMTVATLVGTSVCDSFCECLFLCLTARNSLSNCSQVDFNLFAYASVSSPSCKSNGDIFVPLIPSEPLVNPSSIRRHIIERWLCALQVRSAE